MTNNTNTPGTKPAKRAVANCACGCGKPTVTDRALFLSGHDARLAGVVGRALIAGEADAKARFDGLSPALQAKATRVVETAKRKAADKAAKAKAREAAKAAAKAAYEAALKA